jgi:hypothetical protein
MSVYSGPEFNESGLVYYHDMNNKKSYAGAPTTNHVPSADTMPGWSTYGGTPVAFQTEFGTTGYRMANAPSWNGIYRGITIPSTGVYTFSVWARYLGGSPNNNGGGVYISGWGGGDSASVTNRTQVGQWQRLSITLNCTTTSMTFYLISYGGTNDGNSDRSSWEVTMPQAEAGSVATTFVAGTRSTSQALRDLMGNHTIPATSLTYNANNTFSFNGSTSRITGSMPAAFTNSANTVNRSWEVVVRPGAAMTTAGLFGHVTGGGCTYYCNGGICIASGRYHFNWFDNSSYQFLDSGITATNGQYAHIVGTWNPADLRARIYVNGELKATGAATNLNYNGSTNEFQVGYFSASSNPYTGTIDVAKYYFNKTMTDAEVYSNYTALRLRYGI